VRAVILARRRSAAALQAEIEPDRTSSRPATASRERPGNAIVMPTQAHDGTPGRERDVEQHG